MKEKWALFSEEGVLGNKPRESVRIVPKTMNSGQALVSRHSVPLGHKTQKRYNLCALSVSLSRFPGATGSGWKACK